MKSVVTRKSPDTHTLGEPAAKTAEKLCPQMATHLEASTIFYLNIQMQTHYHDTKHTATCKHPTTARVFSILPRNVLC